MFRVEPKLSQMLGPLEAFRSGADLCRPSDPEKGWYELGPCLNQGATADVFAAIRIRPADDGGTTCTFRQVVLKRVRTIGPKLKRSAYCCISVGATLGNHENSGNCCISVGATLGNHENSNIYRGYLRKYRYIFITYTLRMGSTMFAVSLEQRHFQFAGDICPYIARPHICPPPYAN